MVKLVKLELKNANMKHTEDEMAQFHMVGKTQNRNLQKLKETVNLSSQC